jgi:signal transduction histidine kinase
LGIKQHNSIKIKYLGGSSALVVTIISSVLLIGYIYNAPLLYGSQIIPVAFPTAICFFIFSFSLLRLYKLPYWTFSLINEDPINLKLLKTFIPIIIFIVFFQGFLESTFFENRNNPTLTSAFILIIVIVITTTVILKVSSIISAQIKKVEKAEKTALKETMRLLEIADKSRQALLSVVEDEKKIKAEFIKLNETLEQRIEERTRMLEIANQELEAFSYSVSHDLRAPLRHISGYVEMLSKSLTDTIPEKTKHYLFTISDSAHQMGILIDDLLQFSRTGRQEMHQANLDMNFLLQNVLEIIQASPPSQNIEWSIADLPKVYGDPAMLRLVWLNLINNAVKYSSKKKKAIIEVGHYDENNESVFFVRDNGAGFDMKYASKLFGVFQRMHSSSEYEGTGIGLANVRRIILKHGGRVWAEAETGKGATFYFSLPKITKTNN